MNGLQRPRPFLLASLDFSSRKDAIAADSEGVLFFGASGTGNMHYRTPGEDCFAH